MALITQPDKCGHGNEWHTCRACAVELQRLVYMAMSNSPHWEKWVPPEFRREQVTPPIPKSMPPPPPTWGTVMALEKDLERARHTVEEQTAAIGSWTVALEDARQEIRQLKQETVENILVPTVLAIALVEILDGWVAPAQREVRDKFRQLVELHQVKLEFMEKLKS